MKKFILLFVLTIVSCSSESEESNANNNTTEKKLLSFELYSVPNEQGCSEWVNSYFEYENDKVVRRDYQHIIYYGCEDMSYQYGSLEYEEFDYFNDKVIHSNPNNGYIEEISITENGLLYGGVYENGYLQSGGDIQINWESNNIISLYEEGQLISQSEYTSYDNLTRFLGIHLSFDDLFDVYNAPLLISGLWGKDCEKLPSKTIYHYNSGNSYQVNYSYTFDNEGYPTYINTVSDDGYERTYKLTYTN